MACCQERACSFFLLFIFVWFHSSAAKGYVPVLKDFPTSIFQRHLKVSRHHPVCVVFRKSAGLGSKLEKTVYDLWKNQEASANYTSWEFGSFDVQKDRLPPKTKSPDKLPAVRCYLGESSVYSYSGKSNRAGINEWLHDLAALHVQQNEEVTPELLQDIQQKFKIVLMAFPDGPRHHEVEDMVYEVASELESCKALAVHLNSVYVKSLREKYRFSKYPSVVVIHNRVIRRKGVKKVVEDFRVFSHVEVTKHVLHTYITARTVLAPLYSVEDFKNLHSQNESGLLQFRPVLVCFYAYWAKDVKGYLYAFNSTVLQYRSDKVKLRFGLFDLTHPDGKTVVDLYLKHGAMREIPFLVLYFKDNNGKVTNRHIHGGRPYPWILFDHIKGIQNDLVTMTGVRSYEPPWGTITFDQFDTDSIERQLVSHEGIPILTKDTWTKVVEKSHAPRHIFYKAGKWAGEVTKVSLVVFIMANCGNCRRNNQTFKDIQRAVLHVDGGAMYYVNCTAERELCATHNIRGFPIITAFRGLGWMDNAPCLSANSKSSFQRFVRLDYHGVIKTETIMDWFSSIAGNAVQNMKMDPVPFSFQRKDVKVVATLDPIMAGDISQPVYGYKCLRLLCERLFSLMDCYTQYSDTVSEMEYNKPDLDLVVSKIEFSRSDGVSTVIMRAGYSLQNTLEDMTDTILHGLHTSHSYGIKAGQTCEENPAICTDILTEFVLEHSKLPVTPITSDLFHTASSSLKRDDLPILIALAHAGNITASSSFFKNLTKVAYEVYNSLTVMTLNVNKYTVWATKFVPKMYGHHRVWESDNLDPQLMYVYPRLCIVKKSDHHHAAFYPPTDRKKRRQDDFSTEHILKFINNYLKNPKTAVIETEEF